MERKAFFVLALASILAAFAFGVLFSQNAYAQGSNGQRQLPFFPAQSELWSFSANPSTYVQGVDGYAMTVVPDSRGRLPVLTTIHTGLTQSPYLYREINGSWQLWEIGDLVTGVPQQQSRFHNSIGVVLTPGRYLVRGGQDLRFLLLSGYWANP